MTVKDLLNIADSKVDTYKRTYVRIGERNCEEYKADNGITLKLHVNVYSKTWSKWTASFYDEDGCYIGHRGIVRRKLNAGIIK